jgi:sec-independent protein translocase protein TatB
VFNLSGSEIVFILLAGLVVLGPEKLPGAIRQVGRIYSELRKMGQGFQDELRSTLDEPMRELRETADLARSTLNQPLGEDGPDLSALTPRSISSSVQRMLDGDATPTAEPGTTDPADTPATDTPVTDTPITDTPAGDVDGDDDRPNES